MTSRRDIVTLNLWTENSTISSRGPSNLSNYSFETLSYSRSRSLYPSSRWIGVAVVSNPTIWWMLPTWNWASSGEIYVAQEIWFIIDVIILDFFVVYDLYSFNVDTDLLWDFSFIHLKERVPIRSYFFYIFMQLIGKIGQNNSLAFPSLGWCPNPGSATSKCKTKKISHRTIHTYLTPEQESKSFDFVQVFKKFS